MTRAAAALDIVADLRIDAGGSEVVIRSEPGGMVVTLPALRAGLALLGPRSARRARITELDRELRTLGLHSVVRWRTQDIARFGKGTRAGIITKLLGLGPLELHPGHVLTAAVMSVRRDSLGAIGARWTG